MDENYLHSGEPPDADTPDEQLYDIFRRTRGREAMGILLDRYADRLTLFVYGIVHQSQDAEEIMLELKECADVIHQTDEKMMRLRERIHRIE